MDLEDDLRSEQEEFCELLQGVSKSLAYMINAKLNGTGAVEDVYQETVLAAWRSRRSLLDTSRFRPWIFQIARNKCSDYFRRNCGQPIMLLEDIDQIEADRYGPRGAVHDEPRALVKETIADLRPGDREILDLLYYKELTVAQIAKKLSIPLGTAKRRLFDARNRLRETISERNDEHEA